MLYQYAVSCKQVSWEFFLDTAKFFLCMAKFFSCMAKFFFVTAKFFLCTAKFKTSKITLGQVQVFPHGPSSMIPDFC